MGNWNSTNDRKFPITTRKNSWNPDIHDQRDKYINLPTVSMFNDVIDLRSDGMPEIYDLNMYEFDINVCSAICSVYIYELNRQFNKKDFTPSLLFQYFNENVINTNGSSIRDGLKVLNKIGMCDDDKYLNVHIEPSIDIYTSAKNNKSVSFKKIRQYLPGIKSALSLRYPIIFGFSIYKSFEDPEGVSKTGIFTIPNESERLIGGLCGVICGYNEVKQEFLIRTCLGEDWGDKGYFWAPYQFIMSEECKNFWTIEKLQVPLNYRSIADVVRGYQIREESESESEESDFFED